MRWCRVSTLCGSLALIPLIVLFSHYSLTAQEPNSSPIGSGSTIVVDGVTVPDIGAMPAFVPMPAGNVNYV
jgi:hypothetical protein